MQIQSTSEEKVPLTLTVTTPAGSPATVDGAPVWEVIAGGGDATIVPSADGMSAEAISGSNVGVTQFKVSADADLGSGVQTIEMLIDYNVVSPQASSLGVTAGTPVLK